jgi:hypothetical protein
MVEQGTSVFETRALPLQTLVPIIPLSFIIAVIGSVLAQPTGAQPLITSFSLFFFLLWGVLLGMFIITLFFSKMAIDKGGIALQTPWVRMLGYRGFPVTLSFDEIEIKPKWGGRVLIITRKKEIGTAKKLFWSTAMLGGFWEMPIKWRETLSALKEAQDKTR